MQLSDGADWRDSTLFGMANFDLDRVLFLLPKVIQSAGAHTFLQAQQYRKAFF